MKRGWSRSVELILKGIPVRVGLEIDGKQSCTKKKLKKGSNFCQAFREGPLKYHAVLEGEGVRPNTTIGEGVKKA